MSRLSALPSLVMAEDLRVDVDGVPACDGLSFASQGDHVLVLGAPHALFEAASGIARVVRGKLVLRGVPAGEAVLRGGVAGAPHDPPLPPRWTVAEYVEWSARLGGLGAADARESSERAITKLQLGPLAKTPTSQLVPHARRATVVAAALATRASILVLDDPLGGLPDDSSVTYARVLADALQDLSWVVFAPRIPLASPLTERADEAIVAGALRIEAQGTPSELARAGRFVARFEGPFDQTIPQLEQRGARIEVDGAHVLLDLGREMSTLDLMAICDAANVAVVELVPVARALT
jgi:ABC-2 type transport system ATP-binding protein